MGVDTTLVKEVREVQVEVMASEECHSFVIEIKSHILLEYLKSDINTCMCDFYVVMDSDRADADRKQ